MKNTDNPITPVPSGQMVLRHNVETALEHYFISLEGQDPEKLHELVIKEVEIGLLKTVMRHAEGNQSKAAAWLGLARGTLRKRLKDYNIS
jgi:Fis family transcriptional regulator